MRGKTAFSLIFLLLLLALIGAKSLLLQLPPVRTQNEPTQFNAIRAKARLARVLGDQRPHPADSPADDAVRSRLVGELQTMGLQPIVRNQQVCNDFQKARLVACARVRNIIAVIGPKSGTALLLASHYDSVPTGPGASDDGIGVATLLEVASIMKNRPLRRPVIFLFDEGEELGLVGARAFLSDPLSRNVDSLLNFEARGVTGPANMFETSQPNGAAIAVFARAVRRPVASSLSTDVVRLIPNDTDVSTLKERGWLTLNYGITGNETRYHSAGDNLAALDARSLEHMGDQALALATELSAGLPGGRAQRIFMDFMGRFLIQMPLWLGIISFTGLFMAFALIASRRGAMARGTGTIIGGIIAAVAIGWLSSGAMGMVRAGVFWRAHPDLSYLAIYASEIAAALGVIRTLGRPLSHEQLRVGYWFVFLLIGAVSAIATPGAIIYFIFPPAVLLIGIVIGRGKSGVEAAAAILAVVLLYLSWGEMLGALEELFTPGPLWIVAPVGAVILIAVLVEANPLLAGASRLILLVASASIAALCWIVVAAAPAYSNDHRQMFAIEHVTAPGGHSYWAVLNDGAPLPPSFAALAHWRRVKLPYSQRPRWVASAPPLSEVRAPALQPLELVRNGNERTMRVRIAANGAERLSLLLPEDSHLKAVGLGAALRSTGNPASGGRFTVTCTGRSCDRAELTLVLGRAQPAVLTLVGARSGLPASAARLLAARPNFAQPQYSPDQIVAFTRIRL